MLTALAAFALQAMHASMGAPPGVPARDTATYSSLALRDIISAAVHGNRLVPSGLGGYRARVESEISIGSQRPDKGEFAFSVEQVASAVSWTRSGAFEQHVDGYRAQFTGLQFASIGFLRNAWAVPSLYGNRLALLFGRDTNRAGPRIGGGRFQATAFAVHPLAEDRERVYRYRGGDTVVVLRLMGRAIPIIRVLVTPRAGIANETVIFTGELDLDATRYHLVRMRGYFARVGGTSPRFRWLRQSRLQSIAFVELVNGEVNQRYWLPSYQRFEGQATAPFIGDARAVFRIVSRFRDYEIAGIDSGAVAIVPPVADTIRPREHRLTYAPASEMTAFTEWHDELGVMSSTVAATDFDDVAPDVWRPTGPPRTTLRPERINDVVHVNRVEGIWTGFGLTRQFREEMPGLTVRAVTGYAWSERTARGRGIVEYNVARMRYALRVGRSLDITNDFRVAFDSGDATSALVGVDDYDYVDRSSAMLSATRLLPGRFGSAVRLDVGVADDRGATVSMPRALLGRERFRDNRGVLDGRYARSALTLEWRPDINGELMRVGYGGRLYYERGDGQLNYQRFEVHGAWRWNHGRWSMAGRADGGEVTGRVLPPQQLFELGSSEALPGYDYKEFAGDRAALLRGVVMYRLNSGNVPIRLTRRLWLPSLSPALSAGVQAGWTELHTPAARIAVAQLGAVPSDTLGSWRPVSRASDGIRATVTMGVRFFGGAVGLLLARPVDHAAHWRLVLSLGGQL